MRGESSALSNVRSAPAPGAREVSTFFPGKNLHNQHLRQPPQTWQIDRQKSLSQQTRGSDLQKKKALARHRRCGVYCGARETVGGSSVSSGCWGEDSNHEYGWARRTPTYVAPIRFLKLATNHRKSRARIPPRHASARNLPQTRISRQSNQYRRRHQAESW